MKPGKPFLVRVGFPGRLAPGEQSSGLIGETETPLLDIYETPDCIVVEADLPGLDPHEIMVRLLDTQLTLEGKRCEQGQAETGNYVRMERCYEDFRRILQLPCAVDPTTSQAAYEQGVLKLRLPKITERRRKAIKIEIK
jgi:HSP20 family protein